MNPKTFFILLPGLLGILASCRKPDTPAPTPPIPVVAVEVTARDQPILGEFTGQTVSSRDVEIRARVEGWLDSIHFQEGFPVTRNQLLYTLDERPFRAALAQAEGALAQSVALVAKTRRDTNRLGSLWLKNAISRQSFDDALAAEQGASAQLLSATAAVESSRIMLGYTRILSPLDGLAGKSEVAAGNLVGRGSNTLLTTVSEIDPISVRFHISEQQYLAWKRRSGLTDLDHQPATDEFELILADGSVHAHRGRARFADREVDPRTGTLLLQAEFPNPAKLVRPGQFARVRVPLQTITNAVLIPQRAISELQATYSVFVVASNNTAEFRQVLPGPRIGSLRVVQQGLSPGDKVIIDGIQKLRHTTPIAPRMTNRIDPTLPDATTIPAR